MNVGLPISLIAATTLVLTGCGGDTTPASKPSTNSPTTVAATAAPSTALGGDAATASAKKIQALVPSVLKVVTITKDNDPNPIFGQPGSYVSAAVIYEKANTCTTLVVACGAKVEVYKSVADATARGKYLLGMKKTGAIVGGEYDYLRGVAVLRVFGGLTPSLAEKYHAAFGGEVAKAQPGAATPHPTG
ncbi:MAG: hypothetical protein ABI662_05710 [Dermatophilaceae bacterium]